MNFWWCGGDCAILFILQPFQVLLSLRLWLEIMTPLLDFKIFLDQLCPIPVKHTVQFSSVQSLSRVRLFATPWIAACQASMFITNSRSSLRLTSIESVMPSSHTINLKFVNTECRRIDGFEGEASSVAWRRLLRVPWTARRSNQSILKEINPGISLEGMMPELKLQYFGHLMRRVDSLEKTLMLGGIGVRRRRVW